MSLWLRAFLHEDFMDDYRDPRRAVAFSLYYFTGDRDACVDDIRRFRQDFADAPARRRELQALGANIAWEPEVLDEVLDMLEEAFLAEIEMGINHRGMEPPADLA